MQLLQIRKREVVEDWHCQRSGDCCRTVPEVVLTREEYDVLEKNLTVGQLYKLRIHEVDNKFIAWQAAPCPLLGKDNKGRDTCTIHEIRPYNCRRFGCLRPDPKVEPFESAPLSPFLKYGNVGCVNLRERLLQSRVARRAYELIQRKAQRWAMNHGWSENASR